MLKLSTGVQGSCGGSFSDREPNPIESNFEQGADMKFILIFSIVAAVLGGCAIVPAGYGDNRDGYYGDRGYNRGDGSYR